MKRAQFLLCVLIGCGGGDTGGISRDDAEALCEQRCEYEADCGSETPIGECVVECAGQIAGWMRSDAAETLFTCSVELECGATDDACEAEVEPLGIHDQFEEACREALGACDATADEIDSFCEVSADPDSDDIGLIRFVTPEIVQELIDCFDVAGCDPQADCLVAVIEEHGIDF